MPRQTSTSQKKRLHVLWSGQVQGVGFRYTVQRYALSLDLEGWVKNLPDGSVEMVVQGPKERIEKLCQNIEDYFTGYIENKKSQITPTFDEFKGFQIVH